MADMMQNPIILDMIPLGGSGEGFIKYSIGALKT
jgi:hypothetical protein